MEIKMAKLGNLVIFMSLFCCTIVAEEESQPNAQISENIKNITEICDVEKQSKSCEKCITNMACHFVIWQSDERNSTVTKCVDIKLSEAAVRKVGPAGNEEGSSHWTMKFQLECNAASDSSEKGTNGNKGAQDDETVTPTTTPSRSSMPGHSDTAHLAKNATIAATNKVLKQTKVSLKRGHSDTRHLQRGHSDTAHLGNDTTVAGSTKTKSPSKPGHSDTSHLTGLKKPATANAAAEPSSGFDAGSFLGGMVLVAALGVLCFAAMKYYNRGNRGFNYLLSPNSRSDIMA